MTDSSGDGPPTPERVPGHPGAVVSPGGDVSGACWNGTGYAVYGDPDGEPVVFAHPAPGSRVIGGLLAGTAADLGVRLVVPERPGYGRSTPGRFVGPFTAAVGVGDVTSHVKSSLSLVDALGIDEFGLVGFSSGAPFAIAMAATRAGRVDDLALVSASTPADLAGATLPFDRFGRDLLGLRDRDGGSWFRPWYVAGSALQWLGSDGGWRGFRPPASESAVLNRIADRAGGIPDEAVRTLYGGSDLDPDRTDDPTPTLRGDLVESLGTVRAGYETERRLLREDWGIDFGLVEARVALLYGTEDATTPPEAGRELANRLGGAYVGTVDGEGHLSTLLAASETALRHAAPSQSRPGASAE